MMVKKINKKENGVMRFLVLVRKELALIWADKQALAIVFLLPLLATVAVGVTGASTERTLDMLTSGRPVDLGVVNLDKSVGDPDHVLSEEFIAVIQRQPYTTIYRFDSVAAAEEALYYENIMGYVIIHNGFEANVSAHFPALMDFYATSLNILAQPLIAQKLNDAIKDFKTEYNYMEDEIVYTSDDWWRLDSPLFTSWPMIMTLTLMASGLMLATQSVVGDSPWLRVALTPSRRFEIISAKICGYTTIGMAQSLVLIAVPMAFFNLALPANFFAVWGYSVFISYAGVSMGVFLSTLAKTKLQGSQFFLMGFMMLFILGSGVFLQSGTIEKFFPMLHNINGVAWLAYKDMAPEIIWSTIYPQLLFGTAFYIAAYISLLFNKEAI